MVQRILLVILLAMSLNGCTSTAPLSEGTLDSPNPAARLYAIRRAGQQRDLSKVPQLVELLDSSDPTERLLVIQSLEHITGSRLDYDPYANPQKREAAIARWVDAVNTRKFVASSQP